MFFSIKSSRNESKKKVNPQYKGPFLNSAPGLFVDNPTLSQGVIKYDIFIIVRELKHITVNTF